MNRLEEFKKYQAQTTPYPLGLDIDKAEGSWIYDKSGKKYLDLEAGVSANVIGHSNPRVVKAIKEQVERYMHVMVYGEFIQDAPLEYCRMLTGMLEPGLDCLYMVNSGTEAIEASIKLAKRVTGRTEMIGAKWAYHGNTQGSLSMLGVEEQKRAFRPLIPDVRFLEFNNFDDIDMITEHTAGVLLESIQGGAGFILPENGWLAAVRERCTQVGAQLIIDEIQPGFGRCGRLFGYQNFGIVPDILAIGKGMGGGLPVGGFVSSLEKMRTFLDNPKMGHVTTFGGNPVVAASCLETLKILTEGDIIPQTLEKEKLFRKYLVHPSIQEIRGMGLMLAPMFASDRTPVKLMKRLLDKGVITFLLLYEKRALRLSPPLTISAEEIEYGCRMICETLDEMVKDGDI
ncbi:MAG: aspartate aminotransferase family protein [Flavobacteriales bacterium]|nr:MAG: aspartate aminotransferase family protein [Flavobacteriales bacterium]